MILNFSGSSGGVQTLNYSVLASLTEPLTPDENTIWVQTGTAVSGYRFDAAQPETAEEGMVWFCAGQSGTISFNALKENGIILYPTRAMQYVGGAWSGVEAKIRQDGQWKNWWDGLLYAPGNECTDVTGGWIAEAIPRTSDGSASARTITSNADGLQVSGVSSKGGIVRAANKINLTGRSSLIFEGSLTNPSTGGTEFWCSICAWTEIGSYSQENVAAAFHVGNGTLEGQQILDLSQVPPGNYYIGFALFGTSTVTMTRLQVQ